MNSFIKGGSTVNICSLDLSKAFDKTNHNGLLIKLMDRIILGTLEYWLSNGWSMHKMVQLFFMFFLNELWSEIRFCPVAYFVCNLFR